MDPVVAKGGMDAASMLLLELMKQQAEKEAAAQKYKIDRENAAKAQLAQAQRDQLSQINTMGQGEQSALGNLIATLSRTAR